MYLGVFSSSCKQQSISNTVWKSCRNDERQNNHLGSARVNATSQTRNLLAWLRSLLAVDQDTFLVGGERAWAGVPSARCLTINDRGERLPAHAHLQLVCVTRFAAVFTLQNLLVRVYSIMWISHGVCHRDLDRGRWSTCCVIMFGACSSYCGRLVVGLPCWS